MSKLDTKSSRVTLRQLCNSGLPAPILLPSLLAALRQIVPATHAAFFYCDELGNMQNMYAERMLSPEAMAHYYEHHYRDSSAAFSIRYLSLVQLKDPVSSRTVSPKEKLSAYYKNTLRPLQVEHIMYGIVRAVPNDKVALGQLSLYRDESSDEFSKEDEDALRDVIHYLGSALGNMPYKPMVNKTDQIAEEAIAIFDENGVQLYAENSWHRLIRLARGELISPMNAKQETAAITKFLEGLLIATRNAKNTLHTVSSPWGRFNFKQHELAGGGGRAIGLTVSRLSVDTIRLTEGAARLGLSAQQREVAVMVALGETNAHIATQLGVTLNTTGYHVKKLFSKLGVHERSAVARILSA